MTQPNVIALFHRAMDTQRPARGNVIKLPLTTRAEVNSMTALLPLRQELLDAFLVCMDQCMTSDDIDKIVAINAFGMNSNNAEAIKRATHELRNVKLTKLNIAWPFSI